MSKKHICLAFKENRMYGYPRTNGHKLDADAMIVSEWFVNILAFGPTMSFHAFNAEDGQ